MANNSQSVAQLFHALSDQTRLSIIERLAGGTKTVTELAEPTGLRLPTVMKHLHLLEAAGIVRSFKLARRRHCSLVPEKLADLQSWISFQQIQWSTQLDRLETFILSNNVEELE